MLTAALLSALVAQSATPSASPPAPSQGVALHRKFAPGQEYEYSMRSTITIEAREVGLETAIPQFQAIDYTFKFRVNRMGVDGIAIGRYERSNMMLTMGEYGDRPETRQVSQPAFKLDVELSPVNEFINVTEVKEPNPTGTRREVRLRVMQDSPSPGQLLDIITDRVSGELYRMALWVGSFDTSFDFNPKFEEDPVKPGDTWKRTFSYAPQRLGGTNRQVNQRLDMTYTYRGMVTVNGRRFQRVTGDLKLDQDIVGFVNEQFGIPALQSPFRSVRVNYTNQVTFDLDPTHFHVVSARSQTSGLINMVASGIQGVAAERKITGEGRLTLTRFSTGPAPTRTPSRPVRRPR